MKKLTFLIIILLVLFAAVGCSKSEDKTDIRGMVTNLSAGEGRIAILVEGTAEADTSYDKASVTITLDTSVFIKTDGSLKRAILSDIKLGDTVEVVFDGAVAESYPVQGRAKTVRILRGE